MVHADETNVLDHCSPSAAFSGIVERSEESGGDERVVLRTVG